MDTFELDKEFTANQEEGYYHEYCRLYLANIALTTQIKDIIDERNHLAQRLSKYEDDDFFSQSDKNNQKGKRMRRNADKIDRYYRCSVKACAKSYGSEGSLNQHYKLKHPEIYATLPNVQSNIGPILKQKECDEHRDKENRHRYANQKLK